MKIYVLNAFTRIDLCCGAEFHRRFVFDGVRYNHFFENSSPGVCDLDQILYNFALCIIRFIFRFGSLCFGHLDTGELKDYPLVVLNRYDLLRGIRFRFRLGIRSLIRPDGNNDRLIVGVAVVVFGLVPAVRIIRISPGRLSVVLACGGGNLCQRLFIGNACDREPVLSLEVFNSLCQRRPVITVTSVTVMAQFFKHVL